MPVNRRAFTACLLSLVGITACAMSACPACAEPPTPHWLPGAVVYCVFPEIFSPHGDLAGVTADLPRLKKLGVTVLWLMPVTPVGQAVGGHPAFNSPYCVQDYYAIRPSYGNADDLTRLVKQAHRLGMKVILDAVLNHTSWDNALIRQHPEFYVHSDGNPHNPESIEKAFTFADVAQLDYARPELQEYMLKMLQWWVKRFDIDGFRFDMASNPAGPSRKIPVSFWQRVPGALKAVKPDLLLLGECLDPALAPVPFSLDYGWKVDYKLKRATHGEDAAAVRIAWQEQTRDFPPGTLHMTLHENWDSEDRDIRLFGDPAGALAAATVSLTLNGVPLIYNGTEVGNDQGKVNPHQKIRWDANPALFAPFYQALLALRHRNPALQQGSLIWLPNSDPAHVLTYLRAEKGTEFLVVVNLSDQAVTGEVSGTEPGTRPIGKGGGWTEVTPPGSPGGHTHAQPPHLSLRSRDFVIFQRRH